MYNNYYEIDNYFIKNEEIVNLVKNALENISLKSNYESELNENPLKYNFNVCYKTKTGKILRGQISMDSEDFLKLIELLSKDENYVNIIKKGFTKNHKIVINGNVVPQEVEYAINTELNNVINNMTLRNIYEKLLINTNNYYLEVYIDSYNNHQFIERDLNIEVSEKIGKIVMRYQNELFCKYLYEANSGLSNIRVLGELYEEVFYNTKDDIIKFINENKTVECDPSKEFYQICFYNTKMGCNNIFYTNKIDEINEILKKEYNSNINKEINYYQDFEVPID